MRIKLVKIIESSANVIIYIVGTLLFIATALVFVETFLRFFFGISHLWAEELTRFLCISAAFLGCVPLAVRGGHITIDFLVERVVKNPQGKIIYEVLVLICTAVTASLLVKWGIQVIEVYGATRTPSFQFPAWVPYSALPVSMGFVVLFACSQLVRIFIDWRGGGN